MLFLSFISNFIPYHAYGEGNGVGRNFEVLVSYLNKITVRAAQVKKSGFLLETFD